MEVASYVQQIALGIVPVLFSISAHEVAHGYVAYLCGDPTAKEAGRLTLNPIKHLDPIGLLVFIITRVIGWAKPVPVNPWNFRNPKRDIIFVAFAGPLTNLVLAALCAVGFRIAISHWPVLLTHVASFLHFGVVPGVEGLYKILTPLTIIIFWGIIINCALFIFNLIPVPPLDGGRIVYGLLPEPLATKYASLERWGLIIVIAVVFVGGADRYFSYAVMKMALILAGAS